MFERDYIKKQVDKFFYELALLLQREMPKEERLREVNDIGVRYTGASLEYWQEQSAEALTEQLDVEHLQMVAEMLYQTYALSGNAVQQQKVRLLYEYIQQATGVFSWELNRRIQQLSD